MSYGLQCARTRQSQCVPCRSNRIAGGYAAMGGGIVLQKLSEKVRACHERAAEARQKAEATANPASKGDFLDMEERWLALSRSYAFSESLGDFTAANSDWRAKFG